MQAGLGRRGRAARGRPGACGCEDRRVGPMVNDVSMSPFVQTFAPVGGDASPAVPTAVEGVGAGAGTDADVRADVRAGTGTAPLLPDAAALSDEALLAALRSAEAAGRRIDAVRARLAAEAAERSRRELGRDGLARRRGCRTAVELLQRLTGISAVTANRRIRLGAATRAVASLTGEVGPAVFPHVASALAAGVLGVDAAAVVVNELRPTLPVAGALAVEAAERALVAGAVAPHPEAPPALDADTVRLQAQVWAAALDPDGAEPTEAQVQRRGVWLLAPRHGLVPLRGNLMPDVAAALTTYADACTSPRSREAPRA